MSDDLKDIYRRIALKYGLDPSRADDTDIIEFFKTQIQELSQQTRQAAFDELLSLTGVPPAGPSPDTPNPLVDSLDDFSNAISDVVQGRASLADWGNSIVSYLRNEMANRTRLGLDKLDANWHMSLDLALDSIDVDMSLSNGDVALRIIPWSRDYASPAMISAFCRFLSASNAASGDIDPNKRILAAKIREDILIHLRFLTTVLNEFSGARRSDPASGYLEYLLTVLRRTASLFPNSFAVRRELLVLESNSSARAHCASQLLQAPEWNAEYRDIESRVGFESFYQLIYDASQVLLRAGFQYPEDVRVVILQWLRGYLNRADVRTRDLRCSDEATSEFQSLALLTIALKEVCFSGDVLEFA